MGNELIVQTPLCVQLVVVVVVVVNDGLAARAVLVFLFDYSGAVGGLSLLDDGGVIPVPVLIPVTADGHAGRPHTDANFVSEGRRSQRRQRCNCQNIPHYDLLSRSAPAITRRPCRSS